MHPRGPALSLFLSTCLLIARSGVHADNPDATPIMPLASLDMIPEAVQLPVTHEGTLAIGIEGRNDKQGTLHVRADGGFRFVYTSGIGTDIDDLRLFSIHSPDGTHVQRPEPLSLLESKVVTSPSFVRSGDKDWLYFTSGNTTEDTPQVWRAAFDGHRFGEPESLPMIPELKRMTGWPHWITHDNEIIVSFRNQRSRPYWGVQTSSLSVEPQLIEDIGAAYVRVVPMTGGGLLFSYQARVEAGNTLTFIRFSEDGRSWSPSEPVTVPEPPSWPEVHDAYALPRRDGGVDLYYSYPSPKRRVRGGFDLYRRALLGPGSKGPEQRITEPEDFDPYSASAHRLADGSVLVTFSKILTTSSRGVEKAQLHLVRLLDDAPLAVDPQSGQSR